MIARLVISSSSGLRQAEIAKTVILKLSHSSSGSLNYLNHPDVLHFPSDSKLGIEQARKIIEHFSLKPYSAKGRVVILENAESLTIEAQNALLKTIEELPESAVLILGGSSEERFLPTILSRCQIIKIPSPASRQVPSSKFQVPSSNYEKGIEKLIKENTAERFEFIEKLKDKEEFLHALVNYFHQDLRLPHHGRIKLNFLKELMQAEKWTKQNVNIRAILEYLMLVMPQKL